MALTVLTPPSSRNLTTLGAVQDVLGTTTNTQDVLIVRLIPRVSQAIVNHCGREFARAVLRETIPGYGGHKLMIGVTTAHPYLPVISIEEIQLSGDVVDADTYVLAEPEEGLIYSETGWKNTGKTFTHIEPVRLPGSEEAEYRVDYTAGYILPSFTVTSGLSGEVLPADVEDAAIMALVSRFTAGNRDLSLASQRIGDASESYRERGAVSLSDEIKDMLQQYVRVA